MELNDTFTLSDDERDNVQKIRDIFQNNIPADLNTDLNLRRWLHGWKGQLNEIEPRLRGYIENRKLTKLDSDDYLETFESLPTYHNFNKFFSTTLLNKPYVNWKDNTIFFSERWENVNFNRIVDKVMTCSDFVKISFIGMEAVYRHVLNQEKRTGRPSGISIVYDMQGCNILEYANPNSAFMKITKICFDLLQDYYCDVLTVVYIINPPLLLSLLWSLVKLFMSPATQKKLIILGSNYKEILPEYFDPDMLPVHYGGNRRDTSGRVDPDTCCNVPFIFADDYKRFSNNCDDFTTEYIRPHGVFEVRKSVKTASSILMWKFWVNSDVEFGIHKAISENETVPVSFCFTFCTPTMAEEGEMICDEPGEYILRFKNTSTFLFSLKLEYCAQVVEKFPAEPHHLIITL